MTLMELYTARREAFREEIALAESGEEVFRAMDALYQSLAYEYAAADGEETALAASMAECLRALAPAAASLGTVKILPPEKPSRREVLGQRLPWTLLLFLAGFLLTFLAVLLPVLDGSLRGSARLLGQAMLCLAGLVLCLFSGLVLGGKRGEETKEPKAEVKADITEILSAVEASILTMDREIREAAEKSALEERISLPWDDGIRLSLPLYQELSSALLRKDGDYALEKLGDVAYLGEKAGYKAVSYDGETGAYFQVLPGESRMTIKPAVVKDGKALVRGLASEKE